MSYDAFELQEQDEDGHFHNAYLDFMQSNQQFDDFIERKAAKRKKKKETTNLDDFIEGNNDEQPLDQRLDT
jgi:hypothetical protein